jgi:hypothetical protein
MFCSSSQQLAGSSVYSSLAAAQSQCQGMGDCWGVSDECSDGNIITLCDASHINSASDLISSNCGSSVYEKIEACSTTDGTAAATTVPCVCGTAVCSVTGDTCDASSNTCVPVPTPSPPVPVCLSDSTPPTYSCAYLAAYCDLAPTSRRRIYGGRAADYCQSTCYVQLGCSLPVTPVPTPAPPTPAPPPTQAVCVNDYTAYGAADCDAAWEEYGLSCQTLGGSYSWDCTGCACPGDEGTWSIVGPDMYCDGDTKLLGDDMSVPQCQAAAFGDPDCGVYVAASRFGTSCNCVLDGLECDMQTSGYGMTVYRYQAHPTPPPPSASTPAPTSAPTLAPSTPAPTSASTPAPTSAPTLAPTPTSSPTPAPTSSPTPAQTSSPTPAPTSSPTPAPTSSPTRAPTSSPTPAPTS